MREIIPTVVPKSLEDVANARKRYAFASSLHIDIADGRFAPNTTWTIGYTDKLPDAKDTNYEVHLMIENPLQAGMTFARAGAKRIIGHIEAFDNAECAREAFDMWQKAGAQEVGIAVRFETSLEELSLYIQLCDFVHMMAIPKIGVQGIPFEPRSIDRIARVKAKYPKVTISVDGGGDMDTINGLAQAGATRFCIGSALAKAKDPEKEYSRLLTAVATV